LLLRLLTEDRLATTHLVAMEVLYSARSRADYDTLRRELQTLVWLPSDEASLDRALEVQRRLAERGQHRLSIPDLLIASAAERHGATVLHHDKDFDLIAAVTGQPTRWIVPPPTREN
jgi:predicted nucleic acid-binding protein